MVYGKRKYEGCRTWGFTILELIMVMAILAILCSIAIPAFSRYFDQCSVSVAMTDIVNIVMEAKLRAVFGNKHAVHFGSDGTVTLLSSAGGDGKWNTGDDIVVKSFRINEKGRGLKFGYGDHGPLPGLTSHPCGVSFDDNTAICNDDMTGTAGTVYVISTSGNAMALVLNSMDSGYAVWKWDGNRWMKK